MNTQPQRSQRSQRKALVALSTFSAVALIGAAWLFSFHRALQGSARRSELFQPVLRELVIRIRRRHLLQQRSGLVDTPLAETRQRQQELRRAAIGFESIANLQRVGREIEP